MSAPQLTYAHSFCHPSPPPAQRPKRSSPPSRTTKSSLGRSASSPISASSICSSIWDPSHSSSCDSYTTNSRIPRYTRASRRGIPSKTCTSLELIWFSPEEFEILHGANGKFFRTFTSFFRTFIPFFRTFIPFFRRICRLLRSYLRNSSEEFGFTGIPHHLPSLPHGIPTATFVRILLQLPHQFGTVKSEFLYLCKRMSGGRTRQELRITLL